jgi:hypothetical protein
MALCIAPFLLEQEEVAKAFPADVVERAQRLLKSFGTVRPAVGRQQQQRWRQQQQLQRAFVCCCHGGCSGRCSCSLQQLHHCQQPWA